MFDRRLGRVRCCGVFVSVIYFCMLLVAPCRSISGFAKLFCNDSAVATVIVAVELLFELGFGTIVGVYQR